MTGISKPKSSHKKNVGPVIRISAVAASAAIAAAAMLMGCRALNAPGIPADDYTLSIKIANTFTPSSTIYLPIGTSQIATLDGGPDGADSNVGGGGGPGWTPVFDVIKDAMNHGKTVFVCDEFGGFQTTSTPVGDDVTFLQGILSRQPVEGQLIMPVDPDAFNLDNEARVKLMEFQKEFGKKLILVDYEGQELATVNGKFIAVIAAKLRVKNQAQQASVSDVEQPLPNPLGNSTRRKPRMI